MVKYKEYYQKMCTEHSALFAKFKKLHDSYAQDKFTWQEDFNREGLVVRAIMEEWDNRLCGRMESGRHATYSANLSEKFWNLIKIDFPLIDFVGVIIKKAKIS